MNPIRQRLIALTGRLTSRLSRQPKTKVEWIHCGSHKAEEEAVKSMAKYGSRWTLKYRNKTKTKGDTAIYFCGVPKQREARCVAKMKIVEPVHTTTYEVYCSAQEHTCTPRTGLTEELKEKVSELQALHVSPSEIYNSVGRDGGVTVQQLYSLMGRNRRKEDPAPTWRSLRNGVSPIRQFGRERRTCSVYSCL